MTGFMGVARSLLADRDRLARVVAAAVLHERELHVVGTGVVVARVEALDARDRVAPPTDQLVLALAVGEAADPVGRQADVHALVGLEVVAQLADPREAALVRLRAPLAQRAHEVALGPAV